MKTPSLTGILRNIILWMLQVTAGMLFVMAGIGKLYGTETSLDLFNAIGIGQWFRYLTGGLELLGGLGLFVPSLAGAGAIVLSIVMLGAVFLHLFVIGGTSVMASILLATTVTIALGRWKELKRTVSFI